MVGVFQTVKISYNSVIPSGQPTLMSTIGVNNVFVGNYSGIYLSYDSAVINNAVFINNNIALYCLNSLNSKVNNSIFTTIVQKLHLQIMVPKVMLKLQFNIAILMEE